MALVDKLRKAREFPFDAQGLRFTIRRPTDLEWTELNRGGLSERRLLPFVIGWGKTDGSPFTEVDLGIVGGEPHPLDFDFDACAEMLADRGELCEAITIAIATAYVEHAKAMKEAAKN